MICVDADIHSKAREFYFEPLDISRDQLRLFRLKRGGGQDPIQGSLEIYDTEKAPSYEALSHVWGSLYPLESIQVNELPFAISKIMLDSLRALRWSDSDRLLWIDMICIDQASAREKGNQVGKMDRIYEKAHRVVIYLGEPNGQSEEGMRLLKHLVDPTDRAAERAWNATPAQQAEAYLTDILDRDWFKRIWTVQEATLAQRVVLQLEESTIEWESDFQVLRAMIFRIKSIAISPFFYLERGQISSLDWSALLFTLESQLRQAARREALPLERNQLDLAFDVRHRRCTDPRDKHYSILNIIENDHGARLRFRPNYMMTLAEVHEQFTKEIESISMHHMSRPSSITDPLL